MDYTVPEILDRLRLVHTLDGFNRSEGLVGLIGTPKFLKEDSNNFQGKIIFNGDGEIDFILKDNLYLFEIIKTAEKNERMVFQIKKEKRDFGQVYGGYFATNGLYYLITPEDTVLTSDKNY